MSAFNGGIILLTYKEGNEIRVSLSSFPETAVSDLREHLGNIEIVEVSLVRQCGDDMADLATLSELVGRIGKFLIENPNVILYYYCDEINAVPAMRSSRDISSPEYRNQLFSILYKKGARHLPELSIIDMPIVFIGEDHKTFIHLISSLISSSDIPEGPFCLAIYVCIKTQVNTLTMSRHSFMHCKTLGHINVRYRP